MKFEAIWVPRSLTHFREIRSILESEDFTFPVSDGGQRVRRSARSPAGTNGRFVQFSVQTENDEWVTCRFTEIGMLVVEARPRYSEAELQRLAKDIYTTLAEQRWVVLAGQLRKNLIPWGEASVEIGEFDVCRIFEAVCNDYLQDCVEMSRQYGIQTDSEKITDLLQRIKQAESCYQYMNAVYGLDRPGLKQHIEYTRDLIEMLYQNVNIQSRRNRQNQLKRIEMIALGISVMVIFLSVLQFLYNAGFV